jgi:hypothetical protein
MNNIAEFIAALDAKTIRPTAQEVEALCTALHSATIDLPEFLWVTKSFEDMADVWTVAINCTNDSDERPADESWKARQDSALFQAYPGFGEAFDALDNLRIRGAI